MTTETERTQCATCAKEKAVATCAGCLKNFCLNHLTEHRQLLTRQFDEIEVSRDLFRQTLIQQATEPQQHPLIQQIDQWEHDAVKKVRQAARKARVSAETFINEHITQLEGKLGKLTDQLRRSREMNDIIETDLEVWKEQLTQLTEQFNKPAHITIQRRPAALINAISVVRSMEQANYTSFMESKK